MNASERFVGRATRGLWGQRRRDAQTELRGAQTELRGALEDKMYRHSLCGLSPAEAERAALRDLGSPHAIARELARVHSAPVALRFTLGLGIAGLLSLQAVAQMPVVQAIVDPRMQPACTLEELYVQLVPGATAATAQRLQASVAGRQQLQNSVLGHATPEHARFLRAALEHPAKLEEYIQNCRQYSPAYAPNLLRLADVYAALRAAGVTVTPLRDNRQVELGFKGEASRQILNLEHRTHQIGADTYISGAILVHVLKQSVTVPLVITGLRNPTLSIGPAKLQLGTPEAPVIATDLYAHLMYDWLTPHLPRAAGEVGPPLAFAQTFLTPDPAGHHLRVNAPSGALYATLSNASFMNDVGRVPGIPPMYSLTVSAVQDGLLPAPLAEGQDIGFARVVSTLPELLAATRNKERALVVYRLNGTDLRQLTYTPVPAAQLRANTAP